MRKKNTHIKHEHVKSLDRQTKGKEERREASKRHTARQTDSFTTFRRKKHQQERTEER